jgi:hypothetical protein
LTENIKVATRSVGGIQKHPRGINRSRYSFGRSSDKDKQIHSGLPCKASLFERLHNTEYPTGRKGETGEDNHENHGEYEEF